MQHGQKVEQPPRALLAAAGFAVKEIAEGHLCCGSAGTYNVLQPEIATRLRDRKLAHIARTRADVVATGNVGCITQLAAGARCPLCTRWSCSTGPPVDRRRAGSAAPYERSTR